METNFTGKISAQLRVKQLEELCLQYIPGYDTKRFKVTAVRVFAGEEFILTVFAADSCHQPIFGEASAVKKFKITGLQPRDVFKYMHDFNFTLSEEKSSVEEMVVINR